MNADAILRPWVRRATNLIADRTADAAAHVRVGDAAAAHKRLIELELALGRHLGDARESFFRTAFPAQRAAIDPEYRTSVLSNEGAERAARTAPIGGKDHYAELDNLIEQARAELRAVVACNAADMRGIAADGRVMLWQARHRDRITAAVAGHLSDAQIALFEAVGRLLTREDVR